MVDPASTRRWMYRGIYLLVCGLLMFLAMLPLNTEPGHIPGPDLIFAFSAAIIMRRPRFAPVGLVVAVLLLSDILFLRPIGLWSAIALLGLEFLRSRSNGATEIPWPSEMFLFAVVFCVSVVTNALFFLIFGVPHTGFISIVLHALMTCVAYPFVLMITHSVLRVRRARPSDFDAAGGAL